ncbi:MAG: hypothetical protein QXI33_00780 [Candidatus Pacearchaeota archaeon]
MENQKNSYDFFYGMGKYLSLGLMFVSAGCLTYNHDNKHTDYYVGKKGFFKRHWLPANEDELSDILVKPYIMPFVQGAESVYKNPEGKK